jgi:hypothetical protein
VSWIQEQYDAGKERWTDILGFDWFLVEYLKTAPSYQLDAYGIQAGADGERWF